MPLALPSKATLVALSLVPVVAPTVYLIAIQAITSRYISASSTQRRVLTPKDKKDVEVAAASSSSISVYSPDTTVADAVAPHSLPAEVFADDAPYVVCCERVVSKPIPLAKLTAGSASSGSLLTTYLRGTMGAFSHTPQGWIMHRIISDPSLKETFSIDHLEKLDFKEGDIACGPHKVTYRSPGRAEMMVQRLEDKPDLVVHAVIVAAVETTSDGENVVLINETWFWRHAQDEKPSMLESATGRWLHTLVGGWMILKGSKKITAPVKAKDE